MPSQRDDLSEIVIIIPAYKPADLLAPFVTDLVNAGLGGVVVVDDGSGPAHADLFSRIEAIPRAKVLRHFVNHGKGYALRTGFNHIATTCPQATGAVTCDADGQHLVADVVAVSSAMNVRDAELTLGVREFESEDIPLRSAFGNSLTRQVFRFITGQKLKDTQTGLRGVPRSLFGLMLSISRNRYDYEMEMLVRAVETGIPVKQVNIETVYEPGNPASHFNPLVDSCRIYHTFARYVLLALFTAAVDFTVFVLLHWTMGKVFLAMAAARLVAGLLNYRLCSKLRSRNNQSRSTAHPGKFSALASFSCLLSYGLVVGGVTFLGVPVPLMKASVETVLFPLNFAIQQQFIFSRKLPW